MLSTHLTQRALKVPDNKGQASLPHPQPLSCEERGVTTRNGASERRLFIPDGGFQPLAQGTA